GQYKTAKITGMGDRSPYADSGENRLHYRAPRFVRSGRAAARAELGSQRHLAASVSRSVMLLPTLKNDTLPVWIVRYENEFADISSRRHGRHYRAADYV